MVSRDGKLDHELRQHLETGDPESPVAVLILPLQNRWPGLVEHLRRSSVDGVSFNVIDLTSISATLPGWLVEKIAERPDVVAVRLSGDDQ